MVKTAEQQTKSQIQSTDKTEDDFMNYITRQRQFEKINIQSFFKKVKQNQKAKQSLRQKQIHINFIMQNKFQKHNTHNFKCPICLQIMIAPALTKCGHIFCLDCLQKCFKYNNTCSICREILKLNDYQICKSIALIIGEFVRNKCNICQKRNYQKRERQFLQKEDERAISIDISVGDYVDYLESVENINFWKQGKVIAIASIKNEKIITIMPSNNSYKRFQFASTSRSLTRHKYHAINASSQYQPMISRWLTTYYQIFSSRGIQVNNLEQFIQVNEEVH